MLYTGCNVLLARRAARHRKRSGPQQPSEDEQGGSGSAVAGSACFISNVPEGLSSAAGVRNARRSKAYVFGVWTSIAVVSGLAMIADTMIPEAFEDAHLLIGLITVAGFLVAYGLAQAD
ncbi:hypothetical protein O7635_10090 [Asanoa sp. WMMD1127]|uniref:hypothetical protein n=1 Tax=Asanoa sp. WMMD1127 TaxID=3016107 RepID=UPI002416C124|nr:hypothetical protein [Asanoa sp. WMMD1127]MDG4822202.1 hypothetical protein [Asanoa sp. WMMD1127]